MSTIPTKIITNLYNKIKPFSCTVIQSRTINHGNYAIKKFRTDKGELSINLYHYDTQIASFYYINDDLDTVIVCNEAYSVSDRDSINSLLYLENKSERTCKRGETIGFLDGKRLIRIHKF